MYTKIKDIFLDVENFVGKSVTIAGFVRTIRDNKTFGFIDLNDGSYFKNIQIVIDNDLENFSNILKINIGSSLIIKGNCVYSVGSKQSFEIKANEIIIEGSSESDYPLQKKRHSVEFLRTIAHLRPRTNLFSAVFRVRSLASFAIHKFFNERNFVYVHTPIITSSDAEGAGQMFKVTSLDLKNSEGKLDFSEDFFGKMVNLTVSGQLSAESYAIAFRDVYTFGPTFRAENSNTTRHAAEFWMIEPEMIFCDINQNMDVAENLLKYIIKYIFENAKLELEFFNEFLDKELINRLENVLENKFERITYTKAIDILKKSNEKFEYDVEWGLDLQTEHERYLTEKVYKKPVFVTDYPKEIKSFYMRQNDDKKTVAAMDLLVPGVGEIMGGSQREERHDIILEKMKELGMNIEDYAWYLDLRKYGTVRHSGFGLGFERCIMYITGVSNIKDVIPFPRTVKNAEF